MEWCMLASLLLNALAILIIIANKDPDGGIVNLAFPIIAAVATVLFISGLVIYDEPQKIREKAVEAGVGKFMADDKGKVVFYFVKPDGSMVEYKRDK